jgi:hypothetical protein
VLLSQLLLHLAWVLGLSAWCWRGR